MSASLWVDLHGAATHFPLALTICSLLCDVGGLLVGNREAARNLHGAGYWTIMLAAGGSALAVASGLVMTRGEMLGAGSLRQHHVFVWPACTLLTGLATWRFLVGEIAPGPARVLYPLFAALAAALMIGAGYWGGEMMTAA
jgi:uncharacterized membrane protein